MAGELRPGMLVRAFYDMNDHPAGYRMVRMLAEADATGSGDPPTIGLSTGWVPATVLEDPEAEERIAKGVLLKLHGHFEDPYRQERPTENGLTWRVREELIRPMGTATSIELSLVVLRWRDYWIPEEMHKSRGHNLLNENFIRDVIENEGSAKEAFKDGRYEVFTIFACTSQHLSAVPVKELVKSLRGRRKAGFYFIWPTQRPALERLPGDRSRSAGLISEPALTKLMAGLEAENVRTCWPHPLQLYRDLAGKRWASRLGEKARDLKVPPTVVVTRRALDEVGAQTAAADAIRELRRLRKEIHGREVKQGNYRGVVKLSYAWQGEAVLPFEGEAHLQRGLEKLLEGALPEAECLVQERVESVKCEMRVLCCRDRAQGPEAYATELLRMRLHPPRQQHQDATFGLASHHTMTTEEAAHYFESDRSTVLEAEAEVRRLAGKWLDWFKEHPAGPPAVIRLDFLVSSLPESNPKFEVNTCELTECGGAVCGLKVATRTAAVLNECMTDESQPPAEGFPKPLPALQQEDVGSRRTPMSRGNTYAGRNRGRESNREELSDRAAAGRSTILLALLLAFFMAQGRLVTAVKNRLPRLSVALLASGAVAAVVAKRFLKPPGSIQR